MRQRPGRFEIGDPGASDFIQNWRCQGSKYWDADIETTDEAGFMEQIAKSLDKTLFRFWAKQDDQLTRGQVAVAVKAPQDFNIPIANRYVFADWGTAETRAAANRI